MFNTTLLQTVLTQSFVYDNSPRKRANSYGLNDFILFGRVGRQNENPSS